jgi:hypothetical protein
MSSLCEVRQRLQTALLEASVALRTCLNSEAFAAAADSGRVDRNLKRRITKAQVEHQTAKAALLRHIREHGCSTHILPKRD